MTLGIENFAKVDTGMLYSCSYSLPKLKGRSGEIGRRTGFKILRGQPRVGSIPTSGTIYLTGFTLGALAPFLLGGF